MFEDLNDPVPPPVDRLAIAARARTLQRRRSSSWVIVGVLIIGASSLIAVQLQGDTQQVLVTSDNPSQAAGQSCLSQSLSAGAVWSANEQTYVQPTASPPTQQRATELQGFITFTNTSDVSCSLEGAPSLALLGPDSEVLPVAAKTINCIPAPCTGPGAVVLPDGNPGMLLAPQQRAGSLFLWLAPYCGPGLGATPRLRVTVPGGEPIDVSLEDRDPMHPATQPSCNRAVPGNGGIEVYVFQIAPRLAAPTQSP